QNTFISQVLSQTSIQLSKTATGPNVGLTFTATLTISNPAGGNFTGNLTYIGTTAQGVASIDTSGHVSGVTITNPGKGYTSLPGITFSGGGGVNAAAATVLSVV